MVWKAKLITKAWIFKPFMDFLLVPKLEYMENQQREQDSWQHRQWYRNHAMVSKAKSITINKQSKAFDLV